MADQNQAGATQDINSGASAKTITSDASSGVPGSQTLPQPNVLSGFASYNYSFSLHCLDTASYNSPSATYMTGDLPPIICKSAGSNPDYRFKSTDTGTSYEFYINDLVLNGAYAFNPKIGNTSNLTLEFTVVEPYSMMAFVSVLTAAAGQANYANYNDAVYLLVIQFRGNTETGAIQNIPNTARFIPFRFTSINAKVNAGGATYKCKGYVANYEAATDVYMQTKEDTTIEGSTIQEILQTGENGLQAVLNRYYAEQKKTGKVSVSEQVFITFPKIKDLSNSTPGLFAKASKVTPSADDAAFLKTLGLQKATGATADVVIAQQDPSTLNDIGTAKLGFGPGRQGHKVPQNIAKVWSEKNDDWNPIQQENLNPAFVKMQFSQTTKVMDIINKVIVMSNYGVKALDDQAVNDEGFRPWWRVDMQVYHIPTTANDTKTGTKPRIVVYRILPYKAHDDKMTAVNAAAPGYKALSKQVAKVYNYIYTGLNSEVIDFNIEIKNTFLSLMAPDMAAFTQDELLRNQQSKIASTKDAGKPTISAPTDGDKASNLSPATSQTMKYMHWQNSFDGITPTPGIVAQTRAVEMMHRAFHENYDMINGHIKIAGDPYYIANSGMGNYQAVLTDQHNITADGDMDYQQSEVDFLIHFQTPVDINQATGLYTLHAKTSYEFSGLYKLTTVKSIFKDGQFTQELQAYRRPNQDNPNSNSSGVQPKKGLSSNLAPKS